MSESSDRHTRAMRYLNSPRPAKTRRAFDPAHFGTPAPLALWQRVLPWLLAAAALALIIGCSGCSHHARRYTVPDAKPLQSKQAEVSRHASRAARAVAAAEVAHTRAVTQHAAEGTIIEEATAILARPEFRNAPPELKPEIDALAAKLAEFTAAHDATTASMGEVTLLLAEGHGEAASAVAGADEITAKLGPAYVAKVAEITAGANAAETAWAKDSSKITWMVTHSILFTIAGIVGLAGVGLVLFLKFTGRLAGAAAGIAAKLP